MSTHWECLAAGVARSLTYKDVFETLLDLFFELGVPVYIYSNNDSEFIVGKVRRFLSRLSVKTLFTEPGRPRENNHNETFNGKMRDELLVGEIFYSLREAQVLIGARRQHYNTIGLYSSLGYKVPRSGSGYRQSSYIFTDLEIAVVLAVIGALVGEFIGVLA